MAKRGDTLHTTLKLHAIRHPLAVIAVLVPAAFGIAAAFLSAGAVATGATF